MPGDRRGDDDMACLALDHRRQHGMDQSEYAVDVDREQFVPGVGVSDGDVAGNVEPRIGQEDIDLPEMIDGSGNDAVTSAGLVRSAGRASAPPIWPATAPSRSADRPTRASLAPSAASALARARPMPELAPVTSATLPFRSCRIAYLPACASGRFAQHQRAFQQDLLFAAASSPLSILSNSMRSATRPISSQSCETVVSGGQV